MPDPDNYKTKREFMKACVPMVIEEGTAEDGKQGYAICLSMWAQHKSKTKGEKILEAVAKTLKK